jgi:glycosyltransferase involved in cell wall biosynthesis
VSEAKPLVSIALPVFNGSRDVLPAVQSVLDQTFVDWELILIDDGSTDGTQDQLRRLADPRVRLIADGDNKGLAARLNQAIGLARGKYFARMDHDDVAHPERLALQVAYLQAHGDVDLLATKCLAMSESETIVGEVPFAASHADICRRPWLAFYMAHPTWMGKIEWFRRHLYAQPGPYCCEDQELLLRAHQISEYGALAPPLLAYRVRSRVGLRKLLKTRQALVRVQVRQFARTHQYGYLLLSLGAFGLRVASDLLREILPNLRSDVRLAPNATWSQWNEMIAANRKRAGG